MIHNPITPQNYRGIEFVHIDNLPKDQRTQLDDWLPITKFIKIKIAENVLDHCVNYTDYLFWYENYYSKKENYLSEF